MTVTTTTDIEISEKVTESIADALGIDADEVIPEATLLGDLDAESIDLLDMLFRVEKATGVKVKVAELAERIQGGIPDEEFSDENDIISPVGLQHLKTVLPRTDIDALAGTLHADGILELVTVEFVIELVRDRATDQA